MSTPMGVVRAVVADNEDPMNQKRVRLVIPQILGDIPSEWAEPSVAHAAPPKTGTTVWAVFNGGDVHRPVYLPSGAGWAGPITLTPDASGTGLLIKAGGAGNLQEWKQINGDAIARIQSNGCVVVGSGASFDDWAWQNILTSFPGSKGLVIRGAEGQTASLQEWQDSTGAVKADVRPDGTIRSGGVALATTSAVTAVSTRLSTLEGQEIWGNWVNINNGANGWAPHPNIAGYGGSWGNGIQARKNSANTKIQFVGMCRANADIPFNQWVFTVPGDWPRPPVNRMLAGGCTTTAGGEQYCRIDVGSNGAVNVLPSGNGSPVPNGGWFGFMGRVTLDITAPS